MTEAEEKLGSDFVEHAIGPVREVTARSRSISIQTGISGEEEAEDREGGVIGPYIIENDYEEGFRWKRRSSFGFHSSNYTYSSPVDGDR